MSLRDARDGAADRRWFADAYALWVDEVGREAAAAAAALTAVRGVSGPRGAAGAAAIAQAEAARWLAASDAEVLLIARDGAPAGFAIVERRVSPAWSGAAAGGAGPAAVLHRLAEFWIVRGQRGLGIGRAAVPLILDRQAGEWETVALASDAAAVRFWRAAVARYTGGRHTERLQDGEIRQRFFARGAARASNGAR